MLEYIKLLRWLSLYEDLKKKFYILIICIHKNYNATFEYDKWQIEIVVKLCFSEFQSVVDSMFVWALY